MKTIIFSILFVIFGIGCMGAGYIFGGTNLGIGGYPDFSGYEPRKPWDNENEWEASRYKEAVEDYVRDAKEYIKNAENDMERVNAGIEDAVQKANNAVEEYNRWVRSGY